MNYSDHTCRCSMLKIIYSVLSLLKSNRTIFHEPICISVNCVKLHLKNCFHQNRNGRKQKKNPIGKSTLSLQKYNYKERV